MLNLQILNKKSADCGLRRRMKSLSA